MIINHNMSAIYANRQIRKTSREMDQTMEKLSSGLRINRAGDDPSGLAVSEKLRGYIRGLRQAAVNAQDGISFIQTTEGALGEIHDILHRIRELSIQSANGLYTKEDRKIIQVEVKQLVAEVDRIANTTSFNGFTMLTGRFQPGIGTDKMEIHVGADAGTAQQTGGPGLGGTNPPGPGAGGGPANLGQMPDGSKNYNKIQIDIASTTKEGLQIADVNVESAKDSTNTLKKIDEAVGKVSELRANLGAYQNRLEHTIDFLAVASENLQAAESRIRDADIAAQMVKFTKQQILIQSGTAMLVQANIKPQAVLQLLG
jgi:flagellin